MKNKHLTSILLISMLFSSHTTRPMEHIDIQKMGLIVFLAAGCGISWLLSAWYKKHTVPNTHVDLVNLETVTLPHLTANDLAAVLQKEEDKQKESDKATVLYNACKDNDKDKVKKLLQDPHSDQFINTPFMDEYSHPKNTPLHIACKKGHHELVSLLLNCNSIHIHPINKAGSIPLFFACKRNDIEIARQLLSHKNNTLAKQSRLRWSFLNGAKPYHEAIQEACFKGHSDIVTLLLKNNINDCMQLNTDNLLLDTCYNMQVCTDNTKRGSYLAIVNALINDPLINMNQKDRSGFTVFHYAAHNQLLLQLLLNKDSRFINEQSSGSNDYPYHEDDYHYDKDKHASYPKIDKKQTPLHVAVEAGNIECVILFLNYGADQSKKGYWKRTPLSLACTNAQATYPQSKVDKQSAYEEIIKLLLQENPTKDNVSDSLYVSIVSEKEDKTDSSIPKLLLQHGANPNTHGNLFKAAECNVPLLHHMVTYHGGDIYQTDEFHHTIFLTAFMHNNTYPNNLIDYITPMTDNQKKEFMAEELNHVAHSPICFYESFLKNAKRYHDFVGQCLTDADIKPDKKNNGVSLLDIAYEQKKKRSDNFKRTGCMYSYSKNSIYFCNCPNADREKEKSCRKSIRYNDLVIHALLLHTQPAELISIDQVIDHNIATAHRNNPLAYYQLKLAQQQLQKDAIRQKIQGTFVHKTQQ